jgi:ketosteroid isomerase-like protein
MSSTERRLAELNEGYVRAAQNADVEWYREHLSDDYLCSTVDGKLSNKEEFLRRIAGGAAGARYAAVDTRIRVLGDMALIHSGFAYAKPDGSGGRGRYTDIWLLRQGRWLCVSAHFNRF